MGANIASLPCGTSQEIGGICASRKETNFCYQGRRTCCCNSNGIWSSCGCLDNIASLPCGTSQEIGGICATPKETNFCYQGRRTCCCNNNGIWSSCGCKSFFARRGC